MRGVFRDGSPAPLGLSDGRGQGREGLEALVKLLVEIVFPLHKRSPAAGYHVADLEAEVVEYVQTRERGEEGLERGKMAKRRERVGREGAKSGEEEKGEREGKGGGYGG